MQQKVLPACCSIPGRQGCGSAVPSAVLAVGRALLGAAQSIAGWQREDVQVKEERRAVLCRVRVGDAR